MTSNTDFEAESNFVFVSDTSHVMKVQIANEQNQDSNSKQLFRLEIRSTTTEENPLYKSIEYTTTAVHVVRPNYGDSFEYDVEYNQDLCLTYEAEDSRLSMKITIFRNVFDTVPEVIKHDGIVGTIEVIVGNLEMHINDVTHYFDIDTRLIIEVSYSGKAVQM